MKKIFDQNSLIFLIILLIISVAIGLANYIRLPLKNIVDTLNFTVHAIFVISTFLGVLYFVSIKRYLFILAFGPILLIASITSWSLYIPNIPISSGIIDVMQNTEWNVTKEYITLSMVLFFLLFLSLISYIYYIRLKRINPFKTGYIFHFIGSHWYCNYRYPENLKKYLPITKSRSINHNTKEEIINSYDSTILYMDFFVSSIINLVKHENCILIYISDHGELLGENNQWLHAIEHETLHNAASFI